MTIFVILNIIFAFVSLAVGIITHDTYDITFGVFLIVTAHLMWDMTKESDKKGDKNGSNNS